MHTSTKGVSKGHANSKHVIRLHEAPDVANFPRRLATKPMEGRLARLEAALVDPQALDLRLQRRRGHTQACCGAEGSRDSALAFSERILDGVYRMGRQGAGGEWRGRRSRGGPTREPSRIDR